MDGCVCFGAGAACGSVTWHRKGVRSVDRDHEWLTLNSMEWRGSMCFFFFVGTDQCLFCGKREKGVGTGCLGGFWKLGFLEPKVWASVPLFQACKGLLILFPLLVQQLQPDSQMAQNLAILSVEALLVQAKTFVGQFFSMNYHFST